MPLSKLPSTSNLMRLESSGGSYENPVSCSLLAHFEPSSHHSVPKTWQTTRTSTTIATATTATTVTTNTMKHTGVLKVFSRISSTRGAVLSAPSRGTLNSKAAE